MNDKLLTKLKSALLVPMFAVATLGQASIASAAYDLNPPTWMPMTMATISFDAGGALQMVDQSTFGAKCPSWSPTCFSANPISLALDVYSTGNPNLTATSFASWDPAQPWSVLQNKAFSRQFGWWGGSADALATLKATVETTYGTGASIWIEMLSQTAGLETYKAIGKYGVDAGGTTTVTDPTAYTGLFGTAGSSTKWQWDYAMDHNIYAVDLNATNGWGQTFSATYKVYIGDITGMELASAVGKSTIETWTWAAPVPEPETYAMFMAGLGLMGFIARRRRSA